MPARRRSRARPVRAYELKVTLQRVRPPVWRRIKVRSDTRLTDPHGVLQIAMGWDDSHMHEFRAWSKGNGRVRGLPIERDQESNTPLGELLRKPKDHMVYEYDFGDRWEHEVLLERVVDHPPGVRYPRVLVGARACPPEDIGGVGGYARFLQAMREPRHPEHKEMIEWSGGSFDPAAFDVHAVNRAFHGEWAPPELDG